MDEVMINAILQRQSAFIGEVVNKNLFLEAKISVLEKQIIELTANYEKDQAAKKNKAA
jgi:hypothetical protein